MIWGIHYFITKLKLMSSQVAALSNNIIYYSIFQNLSCNESAIIFSSSSTAQYSWKTEFLFIENEHFFSDRI